MPCAGPRDRVFSRYIPIAFSVVGGAAVARGLYFMIMGVGKLALSFCWLAVWLSGWLAADNGRWCDPPVRG
jgi:hypothetical protein